MEFWIQDPLFEIADARSAGSKGAASRRRGQTTGPREAAVMDDRPPRTRLDYTRVTRDPAVAGSHSEQARLAHDLRTGLVQAFNRLTPEQRETIRRAVLRPLSRSDAA